MGEGEGGGGQGCGPGTALPRGPPSVAHPLPCAPPLPPEDPQTGVMPMPLPKHDLRDSGRPRRRKAWSRCSRMAGSRLAVPAAKRAASFQCFAPPPPPSTPVFAPATVFVFPDPGSGGHKDTHYCTSLSTPMALARHSKSRRGGGGRGSTRPRTPYPLLLRGSCICGGAVHGTFCAGVSLG